MSIRINKEGKVRMIIPYSTSFREAEKFLLEKQEWIERTCRKLKERKKERLIYKLDSLPRTKHHEFMISRFPGQNMSFRLSQGLCEIFIPEHLKLEEESCQQWIRHAFTETLRKEAKVILVRRCRDLASEMNIRINNVRVKNIKTRWGSCSVKANINLNIHLMRLPDHLTDYVIRHELVHIIHHNHSNAFWKELDNYVSDARALAKELRNWGRILDE